jgi:hypothetical protein
MKKGHDALGTFQNEYGRAKHENGKGSPRYRRKRVRERKTCKRDPTPSELPKTRKGAENMKTRPNAPDSAENESGSAKCENGTRRPRYRRKRVWARKT